MGMHAEICGKINYQNIESLKTAVKQLEKGDGLRKITSLMTAVIILVMRCLTLITKNLISRFPDSHITTLFSI